MRSIRRSSGGGAAGGGGGPGAGGGGGGGGPRPPGGAGGPRGGRGPLVRRDRGGGRPPAAAGLFPTGHPGDDRRARLAHPDERDGGDQQRGLGPLHDSPAGDGLGAVHHVPGPAARRGGGESVPDPGPVAGPHLGGDAGLGRGASGEARIVLPADLCPGAEPGGVSEQRHEGFDQRDRPARRQGGTAVEDRGLHGPTEAPAEEGPELLLAPVCPVCCGTMICEVYICRGNIQGWTDGVYLSTDGTWDIRDPLLGTVPHTGGLAQGEVYTGSLNAVIPGVLPGNYRILVRSDVTNQERETDEANNLVVSPALSLTVHAL